MLAGERPACPLNRICVDLMDREARLALFEQVGATARSALVTTEGFIAYLTEEEVAELAIDLSRQPSFRRWALDMASPALLALARAQMASVLGAAGSPLQLAPKKARILLPLRRRPIESRSLLETASVLGRLPPELAEAASKFEPEGPKRDPPWSGDVRSSTPCQRARTTCPAAPPGFRASGPASSRYRGRRSRRRRVKARSGSLRISASNRRRRIRGSQTTYCTMRVATNSAKLTDCQGRQW